jgi:hypothetical protein
MAIIDQGPATATPELFLGNTAAEEFHVGGPYNPENGASSAGAPGGGAVYAPTANPQFSGLNPLNPNDQNCGALVSTKSAPTTNQTNGANNGQGSFLVAQNTPNMVPNSGVFIRFQNPA